MTPKEPWHSDGWRVFFAFSAVILLILASAIFFVSVYPPKHFDPGPTGRFTFEEHGKVQGQSVWVIRDGDSEYMFVGGAITKLK
jgi:hypothetical protein